MKLGISQTAPVFGDIQANLDYMLNIMQNYSGKVDLMVFPELSLTGYDLKEKLYDVAISLDSEVIETVCETAKKTNLNVVFGFVEQGENEQIYNSAIFIKDGNISSVQRKIYPTNYGMFEEGKYFSKGKILQVDKIGEFTSSMLICNDAWHPSLPHIAALKNSSLLLCLINSPVDGISSNYSSFEGWERVGKFYASIYGCYVALVNRVGNENGIKFFGGSKIIDPYGEIVAECPYDVPSVQIVDISYQKVKEVRRLLPIVRDEDIHLTLEHYQSILRQTYRY